MNYTLNSLLILRQMLELGSKTIQTMQFYYAEDEPRAMSAADISRKQFPAKGKCQTAFPKNGIDGTSQVTLSTGTIKVSFPVWDVFRCIASYERMCGLKKRYKFDEGGIIGDYEAVDTAIKKVKLLPSPEPRTTSFADWMRKKKEKHPHAILLIKEGANLMAVGGDAYRVRCVLRDNGYENSFRFYDGEYIDNYDDPAAMCRVTFNYSLTGGLLPVLYAGGIRFVIIDKVSVPDIRKRKKNKIKSVIQEEKKSDVTMGKENSCYKEGFRYHIEELAQGTYPVRDGKSDPELRAAIQTMARYLIGKYELQLAYLKFIQKKYGNGHTNPDFYKLFPLAEKEIAGGFIEFYESVGIEEIPEYMPEKMQPIDEGKAPIGTETTTGTNAKVKSEAYERELIPVLELETDTGILLVAGESYFSKLYDEEKMEFRSDMALKKFMEIDAFIDDQLITERPMNMEKIAEAVSAFMQQVEQAI